MAPYGEYTLTTSSALKLESTKFSSDIIKELDSSRIPISISKSGTINVIDGSTTRTYNTDSQTYSKSLTSNAIIKVTTSSGSTLSTLDIDKATDTVQNDNSSILFTADKARQN